MLNTIMLNQNFLLLATKSSKLLLKNNALRFAVNEFFNKISHRKMSELPVEGAAVGDDIFEIPLIRSEKYTGEEVTEKLPGVTRILKATMPLKNKTALLIWKKKVIKELGEEGFEEMQKATISAGWGCHSAIEQFLYGVSVDDIKVEESTSKLWTSVQSILKCIDNVRAVERKCVHPRLRYHGFADCVAEYNGKLCMIDWKTSKKTKYGLNSCYDDPIQVAAYAGAMNCFLEPDKQIHQGLVVKIYHSGRPASAFLMNEFTLEYYWLQWLKRLAEYETMMKETNQEE